MNAGTFKDLTAGIQSVAAVLQIIAAAFALVIGGLWVCYKYRVESEDRSQKLFPALEVVITANQKDKDRLIKGSITIKNVGTQATTMLLAEQDEDGNLTGGPLVVAKVTKMVNGKLQFDAGQTKRFWLSKPQIPGRVATDPQISLRQDVEVQDQCRPQATDHYEFLVPVQETGTYAVMFSGGLDKNEIDRMRRQGIDVEYDWKWEQTTFVDVK